jgi:hypothetical protein
MQDHVINNHPFIPCCADLNVPVLGNDYRKGNDFLTELIIQVEFQNGQSVHRQRLFIAAGQGICRRIEASWFEFHRELIAEQFAEPSVLRNR